MKGRNPWSCDSEICMEGRFMKWVRVGTWSYRFFEFLISSTVGLSSSIASLFTNFRLVSQRKRYRIDTSSSFSGFEGAIFFTRSRRLAIAKSTALWRIKPCPIDEDLISGGNQLPELRKYALCEFSPLNDEDPSWEQPWCHSMTYQVRCTSHTLH